MSSIYKQLSASLIIIFTSTAYAKPTQFYKPYKNTEQVENITPKLYKLGETKVHLESKINTADYLTEDKLATLYQEKMTQQLKTKNLLANDTSARVITLNLDIQQKRIFAGEGFSGLAGGKLVGKYAHSTLQYSSTLVNSDKLLANFQSDEYIGIGKNGNFGKIFRDLSGKGPPQNELDDVDSFVNKMIENLPK